MECPFQASLTRRRPHGWTGRVRGSALACKALGAIAGIYVCTALGHRSHSVVVLVPPSGIGGKYMSRERLWPVARRPPFDRIFCASISYVIHLKEQGGDARGSGGRSNASKLSERTDSLRQARTLDALPNSALSPHAHCSAPTPDGRDDRDLLGVVHSLRRLHRP